MFKRLLILHVLIVFPLLFYNLSKSSQLKTLKKKREELQSLTDKALSFHKVELSNKAIQNLYKNASSQYLYTEIESPPLTSPNQKIQLIESLSSENSFYIEKDEILAQPVQVDLKDIKSILTKVEGEPSTTSKKPHLFFSEFSIKKNKGSENILYDLNFKLIKREYSK